MMANEVHDSLAQTMAYMKMRIEQCCARPSADSR
jgi:nitrate/nitrite-specific signal transduction histidine kinase